ncbi:hypothetical protein DNH61_20980 [Paenibacillus sambharensis]|uniref:DUF3679 domain-containing protein n=1 Tax=Paenibacillus sambharensis TaxID=1803190 RepID=A0A2W1L4X4_9BACL|nr:hypothetical protein [Paenibacillus sambharensis]PZD93963.1 hypothetical protein DNH61_20980 [Paenibacillus sambharensis]
MKRKPFQWAMAGALLVILLLYGLEMSADGIGRIYGPLDHASQQQGMEVQLSKEPPPAEAAPLENGPAVEQNDLAAGNSAKSAEALPGAAGQGLAGYSPPSGEASVNKAAEGAAGFLQGLSSGGIRLVVSLFDAIAG